MHQDVQNLLSFRLYVGLISAVGMFANAILLPALPFIEKEFLRAEWSMTGFLWGAALGQCIWGPLSDYWGRRNALCGGFLLAVFASLICSQADTGTQLIIGRFFQGCGAIAGNAIARAICRDYYKGTLLTRMIAMIFMVVPIASALAPLTGSALIFFSGWRASFWLLTLISLACLCLTFFFLKGIHQTHQKLSLKTIVSEYGVILSDTHSLSVLICIAFIFMGFFVFFTSMTPFIHTLYGLEGMSASIAGVVVPCGIIIGSFYQSTWGWAYPLEKMLGISWTIGWSSLFANLIFTLCYGDSILIYAFCMMVFGGSFSIVTSLSCTLLIKKYPTTIAGTLSSIIGITQTMFAGLGSFFVFLTPNPLTALGLIIFLTGISYLGYLYFRSHACLLNDI